MRVVITGSSNGIGYAVTNMFLAAGHEVFGLDVDVCNRNIISEGYHHYICDVADKNSLPDITGVQVLINNAGIQNSGRDIQVNLQGVINCTEKYGLQPSICSILNQASVSAHNGAEFPEYVASKGGVLSYTIWTAKKVAEYGATCNSISFGGVCTDLNRPVMEDHVAWNEIMEQTPLKKWASPEEAAEWIYFLTMINKSMTAQDIVVDNGEMFNHKFIWN